MSVGSRSGLQLAYTKQAFLFHGSSIKRLRVGRLVWWASSCGCRERERWMSFLFREERDLPGSKLVKLLVIVRGSAVVTDDVLPHVPQSTPRYQYMSLFSLSDRIVAESRSDRSTDSTNYSHFHPPRLSHPIGHPSPQPTASS